MTITRRAFITAAAGMAAASAFPFGEAFAAAPEKKNRKLFLPVLYHLLNMT